MADVARSFWLSRLTRAWAQAPIVWLTGVRRVGKTTLARSIEGAELLNCDLPSVARRLADPEVFYREIDAPIVVFDEVHQLPDPSRLLKIGADERPDLRILATGSSTLAATRKFRDSLTGRKRVVELVPVLVEELAAFGVSSLEHRLLRGGLPPALLAKEPPHDFYAEWLDSYFARDVQELFHLEKRSAFLGTLELLLRQSGGLLDVTRISKEIGVSRPTTMHWLDVLEVTHAIRRLRPFARGGRREIVAQPKVFAVDTGLVAYARAWDRPRPEDAGALWEHVVLETLVSRAPRAIHYWRDKQHREVDFVIPGRGGEVHAVECKWRASAFDPRGLAAFRASYPKGASWVIAADVARGRTERVGEVEIRVAPLGELADALDARSAARASD